MKDVTAEEEEVASEKTKVSKGVGSHSRQCLANLAELESHCLPSGCTVAGSL